jgi:RNA 2',3'-cyclic 3'-phosphodiesterase
MRAFIAIELPEALRERLTREQARFRAAAVEARWTEPQGIHLTLKFLGEISDGQLAHVTKSLKAVGRFEPFRIQTKGFGFFPDARKPRVFWAGLEAPAELAQLAARVETALTPAGFAPESRAFHPHLTLARFKIPRPQPKLQALVAELLETILGQFEVSEFFLWESKLSPQGATYRKVARFPWGSG